MQERLGSVVAIFARGLLARAKYKYRGLSTAQRTMKLSAGSVEMTCFLVIEMMFIGVEMIVYRGQDYVLFLIASFCGA